jgi:hypothetical protein
MQGSKFELGLVQQNVHGIINYVFLIKHEEPCNMVQHGTMQGPKGQAKRASYRAQWEVFKNLLL